VSARWLLVAVLLGTGACLEVGDPIYRGVPVEAPPPVTLQLRDLAPADGAADLPPRDPVVFVFDRDLQDGSASATLVSGGTDVGAVPAVVRKGMLQLMPKSGFQPGVAHVLTLQAVTGTDGAILDAPIELHFSTTANAGDAPRFDEVQAIWSGACALSGCHTGTTPTAQLDLSRGASRAAVGKPSITCGDVTCAASFSCLGTCDTGKPKFQVIWPGVPCQSCMLNYLRAGIMPLARQGETRMPLPERDIDRIERWILAGAPE
jgi:hypothetical protein